MAEYDSRTLARFWSKVDKNGPNGCWIWTAAKLWFGHGAFTVNGKMLRAHRVSFEIANGSIAEGMYVCHRCDVPPCINPKHLFEGSSADNSRDMALKGRAAHQHGELHGASKLTDEAVRQIRDSTEKQKDLAARHRVSRALICLIKSRKVWKHLD